MWHNSEKKREKNMLFGKNRAQWKAADHVSGDGRLWRSDAQTLAQDAHPVG